MELGTQPGNGCAQRLSPAPPPSPPPRYSRPIMHPYSSRPVLPSPTPPQHVTQGVLGHGDKDGLELLPRRLDTLAGKYMCAVAAGEEHSLAVCARKGECFGWGSNSENQLALEGYDRQLEDTQLDSPMSKAAALAAQLVQADRGFFGESSGGGAFSGEPALQGDELRSLNSDDEHPPDATRNDPRLANYKGHLTRPTRINELRNERVISVACSHCGSCAVTSQGEIWRWGRWNGLDLMPSPFKETLLDSHRVVRYLFYPTQPISPICRALRFPYLTFYSCFGQRRSQQPSLPGTHCRRCCLQLAAQ